MLELGSRFSHVHDEKMIKNELVSHTPIIRHTICLSIGRYFYGQIIEEKFLASTQLRRNLLWSKQRVTNCSNITPSISIDIFGIKSIFKCISIRVCTCVGAFVLQNHTFVHTLWLVQRIIFPLVLIYIIKQNTKNEEISSKQMVKNWANEQKVERETHCFSLYSFYVIWLLFFVNARLFNVL